MSLKADICVIGAGSGGLSVAAAAAQFGRKVVLIEKHLMGGDCLNFGCVPSKALIAAGARAQAMRSSAPFGIKPVNPAVDGKAVFAHVREVIEEIAPDDSEERFTGLGCTVIRAAGRFIAPDCVEAGAEKITARRFVIATGSQPFVPDVPGLAEAGFLTNETIFGLGEIPSHLLVMGAGPIGLEMAQSFRRLGAEVTVVERAEALLTRDDPELAAVIGERLQAEGVKFRLGAVISRIHPGPVIELADGEKIAGSHLLVAAGRRPSLQGLGLEAAGIEHDARGVKVDQGLRSSNRRVYAIGDAAGGLQFTHVANYHAGLVIRSALFHLPVKVRNEMMPRSLYTEPGLAQVGLTEADARAQGLAHVVVRWPFERNDRARARRESEGLVKAIASPRGRILGAGIAGPEAGELIAPWQLAISRGLKLSDMAAMVPAYPTLGEVSRRAAVSHFAPLAGKPLVRGLIGLLARLG